MDGFQVRCRVARCGLHGVSEAIEGKEDGGPAGCEEFGDEGREDRPGEFGVLDAELGKAGEGEVWFERGREGVGDGLRGDVEGGEVRVGSGDGGKERGSGGRLGIQGPFVARGGYKRCIGGVT